MQLLRTIHNFICRGVGILRAARWLKVVAWVTLPLFPVLCLFLMDILNFGGTPEGLEVFLTSFPGAARFELLATGLLFLVLLFLCRRAWIAGGLLAVASIICSYVNYTKLALNGDPFTPQDIVMVSSAGDLTEFISGRVPGWFFLCAALLLVWVLLLALVDLRLPLRWFIRLPLVLAVCAAVWYPCSDIDRADALLGRFGMSVFDSALQRSNYEANGFVGGFCVNLLSLGVQEPEGYSRETVAELLADYPPVPAREDAELFDVVVVLSESFFDARILDGVSFSKNPLPNYDRLLTHPRCCSGSVVTTAIGGGTIRPEFSLLTGMTMDYVPSVPTPYRYITRPVPTYVSNYQSMGYDTIAMHPYNKQFYSRQQAYGYMGFDNFWGQDEIAGTIYAEYKRGFVTDESTLRAIRHYMDHATRPTFLFAITMQNHQPYSGIDPALIQVEVSSDRLSPPALTALTTYTQGLYDADKMLGDLVAWIDRRERPTVLVFFGDHMPTLGDNYLAYRESGLFDTRDSMTGEELLSMYSTPFLIYSNRELEAGLLDGQRDNLISDYNLLNSVAISTGMPRTPYMELLANFHRVTPIYNVRLDMELTDDILPYARAMEYITYDSVFGEEYYSGTACCD